MATSSRETTKANGIGIRQQDGHDNVAARRLAARLERAHPAVDYVRGGFEYEQMCDAKVYLRDGVCDGFVAPDGWKIDSVFVSSYNQTAVRVSREG